MRVQHLFFLALFSFLAACSGKKVVDENLSERELYEQAQTDLNKNNYSAAIRKLQALESRYPFGRYAEQSQLELMYAHYKNRDYEAVNATADRFVRLHPQHENADYAYYMRGLAAFEQDRGILARFLPLDMTQRDPGATRDSYNEFARLIQRYPSSQYAPDAKQRMIYARNLLADYEVHAARYYIKRKAYVAALNRGRYIVENFQGTPAVPDGLAIMVQSYRILGMDDLADDSLATLQANYPEHPSLTTRAKKRSKKQARRDSFNPDYKEAASRSWLNKVSFGLLGKDNRLERPPVRTQADREMQRQIKEAEESLPKEIRKKAN